MNIFFVFYFIPTIMIVFGVLFYFFTPKKNRWFGYRSISSLKTDDSWKYANRICGFYGIIAGAILQLISTLLLFIFNKHAYFENIKQISLIIELIVMLSVIPYTEIITYKKFRK